MQKTIIKLDEVWKIYQMGEVKVPALKGLNIDIKKGEFVSIMGPSGSGKSTALNSIGALDIPTKGIILIENQNISELAESTLAQIRGQKVGFIFQTFNLIQTLTAIENVMLPMVFQNTPEDKRFERAKELLTLVNLQDRLYFRPTQLSGGEQQRVAIARALANNPSVILADEPTGNLDSKSSLEVIKLLTNLNKKGKTIILITHNLNLAKHAQRIISIKDGKVVGVKKCKRRAS